MQSSSGGDSLPPQTEAISVNVCVEVDNPEPWLRIVQEKGVGPLLPGTGPPGASHKRGPTPFSRSLLTDPESGSHNIPTAVLAAAAFRGFARGRIDVLVTDDETIREINCRHLSHDYETDVISFPYRCEPPEVEGEMVVSRCTARRTAAEVGWDWRNELLLYVIHGTLHLCGMEDESDGGRSEMRAAEQTVLERLGICDTAALRAGFEPGSDESVVG